MGVDNSEKDNDKETHKEYLRNGTDTQWYRGRDISDKKREKYRETTLKSIEAKKRAQMGEGPRSKVPVNIPKFNPADLMPQIESNELETLSLFSGGGGMDLGFDLGGFDHFASYEILDFAAETIEKNRPRWKVFSSDKGDVTSIDWRTFKGEIDIIHGGPPCQPFSTSGRQKGADDARDMIPEFIRAINEIQPRGFLMENVPGLYAKKFEGYLKTTFYKPLKEKFVINKFLLEAPSFGVPQMRKRLFFVGLNKKENVVFSPPFPTHHWQHIKGSTKHITQIQQSTLSISNKENNETLIRCLGVREALGLPDIGFDGLAPTLRSALTGPRHTTSILSSVSASKKWAHLEIWPNGVALTREDANAFVAKNNHFRLSVPDCGIIQGFPKTWKFKGPVYKALGQIGNAVPPIMAYNIAKSLGLSLAKA